MDIKSVLSLLLGIILSASPHLRGQDHLDLKFKCIVLDPGHGGKDYGCISRDKKYNEKTIVLSVAKKLGDKIKKNYPDIKVVYTRTKDVFIPLNERANIANKNKADLFLSIHVNSTGNSTSARGTETFTMGNHVSNSNFELSKRENSVILMEDNYASKYEGFKPSSPESYIIFSLLQNAYSEQSINFARLIQEQFSKGPIKVNRGVKQAGFLVLWRTTMPSVLTELGFISNPEDLKILTSEKGQNDLANRLFDAFVKYKNEYEKSLSSSTSEMSSDLQQVVSEESNNNTISDDENKTEIVENKSDTAITYHIQIMSVGKKLKSNAPDFKGERNVSFVLEKGLYKYYVGSYQSREEALQNLENVRNKFKGAFVIGIKEGVIVSR